MSGYNSNHQFFGAELAGAARKMPPPIVPAANSNNATAHISIRYAKVNSTKPVMSTVSPSLAYSCMSADLISGSLYSDLSAFQYS
jgi:hypothetical protein